MKKSIIISACFVILSLVLVNISFANEPTCIIPICDNVIVKGQDCLFGGVLFVGTDAEQYDGTNGLDGKDVELYTRYFNEDHWMSLGQTTTETIEGLSGVFGGYVSGLDYNSYFYVYFPGDIDYQECTSQVFACKVRVKISISGRKYSRYYRISGGVAPNKAKKIISIRVKRGGSSWKTVKRLRLSSTSRYAYRYYWPRKGTYRIRVYYGGDTLNAKNYSAIKKFIVK